MTVTWKVADGIYQHVDIMEKDKPNPFTLGKRLLIGEEVRTAPTLRLLVIVASVITLMWFHVVL